MDRSWISSSKFSESYKNGVEEFLRFASQNLPEVEKLICPCKRCNNSGTLKRSTVRKHLLKHGFNRNYTRWIFHGELDLTACNAEGSSEFSETNDGDVDRGDDSKPTEEPGECRCHPKHAKNEGKEVVLVNEVTNQHVISEEDHHSQKDAATGEVTRELPPEGSSELTDKNYGDVNRGDSTSHAKPAKDKGTAMLERDGASAQQANIVSGSEEEQLQGPANQEIPNVVEQQPELLDMKMFAFAYSLYEMRSKFGCERELFSSLIRHLKILHPMFDRLPKMFNYFWNQFDHFMSNKDGGSSSREPIQERSDQNRWKCYACGQEVQPSAIAFSQRRRGNKGKQRRKKNTK